MIANRYRRVLVALATLTLPLTSPQSLSAQSTVPKKIWFPTGLDVIRDPLTGRLGVPQFYGDTVVSGSANSPVIWQDPATKDALLYIGASNGGVYLRRYSYAEDRWSDRWTWVSRPGSGYTGSQSIGVLSISSDGRYLAVGQGNASNYASFGVPGNGIQIGAIQADGSLQWLENSPAANAILSAGLPVRSLHWQGQYLAATTWNTSDMYPGKKGGSVLIASQSATGGLETVNESWKAGWNLMTDRVKAVPNGPILAAGNNVVAIAGAFTNTVGVVMGDGSVNSLEGSLYTTYLQGLDANKLKIARISVHPQMVNGSIVAFVGSYARILIGKEYKELISRIDRLVINPLTYELIDFTIGNVQGEIGSNQAENVGPYGNFSLSANPLDPLGFGVFSGGNTYGGKYAYTIGGGLVQVGFGSNSVSLDYLYGPNSSNGQIGDPPPGAPHADSRQITYYDTPNGLALIQTDDGGVWQLPLQGEGIRWWSSLSAPGLNTLENTTVDWNATTNAVVAAYQDNAASVGSYGSPYPYMQNVWMGDGQLAFFDDAKATPVGQLTSAYVSSYQYLKNPLIQRTALDKAGLFKSYDLVNLYLTIKGETVPLSEEPFCEAQKLTVPFSAPLSSNAYRPNDIVMAGRFNVYETTAVDPKTLPNSLVFQPLIDDDVDSDSPSDVPTYWVNAIDNRGSPKAARARTAYDSLYVGLQIAGPGGKGVKFSGIYGRQAGATPLLAPLVQVGQDAGPILAIAHRSTAKKGDTVFWLQGGSNVGNINNSKVAGTELQSLAIRSPNGQTRFIPLTELGIGFSPSDVFKAQSLVYVPAVNGHGEHLVIGSQEGAWISSLNRNGEPGAFTRMNWQGLPEGTPPGSLNVTMTYDPQDDLLVTTQLGQGAWLYSFRGQIKPAKVSAQKLILSDTVLSQQVTPALDKRGSQLNTLLFVQLNDKLMDPTQAYDVDLVFDNFAQWKNNLELLSPQGGTNTTSIPPSYNLLDTSGQARFNASLSGGKLTLPIHLEPGVTKMAISVNIKEFPKYVPTFSLNFSATLRGSGDSAAGHLVLSSGSPARTVYIPGGRSQLDPLSPEFNPQNPDSLPRYSFKSKQRVAVPNSDDDIVYIGTKGTQVKTGKGADLLYVDGHTAGTNKLYGGPGKNQFRLVGSYQDIPEHAQSVMDFKPGRDTIGLVGVTYEDLRFKNSAQGAELYVFGQKVGIFRNIGKQALMRKRNFVFYP